MNIYKNGNEIASMRRKLIKQGEKSATVTVPAKWLQSHHLAVGDEVDILEDNNKLVILPSGESKKRKEITISLPKIKQQFTFVGFLRDSVVMSYNAGYDKITIHHKANPKIFSELVDTLLSGCEITELTDKKCVIEVVSDLSYKDFDNVMLRLFYITKDMVDDFTNPNMIRHSQTLSKYLILLQRSVANREFNHEAEQFYVTLFHLFTDIGKNCHEINRLIRKGLIQPPEKNNKIYKRINELVKVMQKAYQTSEYMQLHLQQQQLH